MQPRSSGKEALKALREERKAWIQQARSKVKAQGRAIQAIRKALAQDSKTVPEIAAATGTPTGETLWYIAALKKYGIVKEVEKDGSYFKYGLTGEEKTSTPNQGFTSDPEASTPPDPREEE
ncbi:MAG: hypothetical protein ACOWWM_04295 [Desulfobacterales bacterium]